MRIGIDFGTSYSAAGAVVDGQLRLIRFGDDHQFRTTVFFPLRMPDVAQFELTEALNEQVRALVAGAKRDQTQELARVQRLRDEAMRQPAHLRAQALALVPTARKQSDFEMQRAAVVAVRRQWAADQVRKAMEAGADVHNALYGDEAVEAYMASGTGHLVVSPKSMLGYKLEGNARETLLRIATQLLRHIRASASAQLDTDVRAAVMGRPVRFRSSMKEAGSAQALEILTDAAYAAGFDAIEFLEEPAAAAYGYHREQATASRTLILDIGGGTTDIALADVGGPASAPVIHGSWGDPVGGTDVDIELSMRGVMAQFGKGVTPTAVHRYYEASTVQDLERQSNFRLASFKDVEAPYGPRLQRLQEPGHTVRLNRDVEAAKIGLSSQDRVGFTLDYIEDGLCVQLDKERLQDAASPFLRHLGELIRKAKADLREAPDSVYLTGGMSRSPYVPAIAREMFPAARIVAGDASLGVVAGLAHAAAVD
ncbi:Hsp70 family protein [Lysobacter sp. 5GHs7-4]|uniref:Hsp70 family protein n=1 Tax=Lysobacter sp. 5GHs7-4 TaxID=2904253 RepID=UPI001E394D90|nr:Hsp70 family protein [Lysobacter sp. 5GHs7-4]UHQ21436.1 Hsp70 family protein [Lysobacter sp. 5GHs7-4]